MSPKPLTFTPAAAEALLRTRSVYLPHWPPPSPGEVLEEIGKIRDLLKRQRADPSLPRSCIDPRTGKTIDLLDGETDRMLDRIEAVAQARLKAGN